VALTIALLETSSEFTLKNDWLEDECPFGSKKHRFQGRAVSFREGNRWVYKGATKAKSQNYHPEKFV